MHLDESTLNEWLDEALPAAERAAAAAHLAGCPECAARLAELRLVFAQLEALPEVPLARDLTPTVLGRLPARATPALGRGWPWALALQTALAVGVLLLAAPAVDLAGPAGLATTWAQGLAAGWAGLSAQTQTDLAAAWQAGAQLLNDARALGAPLGEWPAAAWSAGLALLGLLWLAGNGLALRRLIGPSTPPRSR